MEESRLPGDKAEMRSVYKIMDGSILKLLVMAEGLSISSLLLLPLQRETLRWFLTVYSLSKEIRAFKGSSDFFFSSTQAVPSQVTEMFVSILK